MALTANHLTGGFLCQNDQHGDQVYIQESNYHPNEHSITSQPLHPWQETQEIFRSSIVCT